MSARIRAPSDLPELVRAGFAKALSEGELHYFPTQVTLLQANSIPVSRLSASCTRLGLGDRVES